MYLMFPTRRYESDSDECTQPVSHPPRVHNPVMPREFQSPHTEMMQLHQTVIGRGIHKVLFGNTDADTVITTWNYTREIVAVRFVVAISGTDTEGDRNPSMCEHAQFCESPSAYRHRSSKYNHNMGKYESKRL